MALSVMLEPLLATMNILLHEDSAADAEIVQAVLLAAGIEAAFCRTGDRAEYESFLRNGCGAFGVEDLDLVLADFHTPGLEGEEALALIREEGYAGAFIIISGGIGEEKAVELIKKGADDLVIKGNLNRLASSVLRGIRDKNLRRDRDLALERARYAEAEYQTLFQNAVEGVFQIGEDGRFLRVNPALVSILGFRTTDELLSMSGDQIARLYRDPAQYWLFLETIQERKALLSFESEMVRPDGGIIWISQNARSIAAGPGGHGRSGGLAGGKARVEGFVIDVTQRKLTESRLQRLAYQDSLTNLPNRVHFMDRLGHALARARRDPDLKLSVFFLDLDRFKYVNDTLGHPMGDQLLIEFAARLGRTLRQTDTPARLGGDEFALLLENVGEEPDLEPILERLRAEFAQPFLLGRQAAHVSASIGVVKNAHEYGSADAVIRDADIAMYNAKRSNQGGVAFFREEMKTASETIFQIENELRAAIKNREFELHYQPIVTPCDGKPFKFEALLRWNHPTKGLLLPGAFLEVAESAGLIVEIGKWAFDSACGTLARWQRRYGVFTPNMSVNVSALQFADPRFVEFIQETLSAHEVDPWRIEVEITESRVIENLDKAVDVLRRLKTLGLRIAIDDFGSGYSSLSYLHTLPIDIIKIERQFVQTLGKRAAETESGEGQDAGQDIVGVILTLAHSMKVETVAEGVETKEQVDHVARMGCHFAQGFYFSKALPTEGAEGFLARHVR